MKIKAISRAGATTGLLCIGILMSAGCAKKVAVATPPPVTFPASHSAADTSAATSRSSQAPATRRTEAASVARTPNEATRARIADLLKRIEDAYFDYNTADIRADASSTLQADARTLSEILRDYPDYKLTVEGYCDERGSAEYNLALGQARAEKARLFLGNSGIPARQVLTVSFGKERQTCAEHDESCWQKNRRIHITQAQG